MINKLNKKIAIIGAGPAGLAAAEALREKGYTDITLFDRSMRVGGQSYTCEYTSPDKKTIRYDIGSAQPMSSPILLRLLKQFGLNLGRGPLQDKSKVVVAYSAEHNKEVLNYLKYRFGFPWYKMPLVFLDLLKLKQYMKRYKRLAEPGFYDFEHLEETATGFTQWMEEKKFKVLGPVLIPQMCSLMTLVNKNMEDKVYAYKVFKFLHQQLKTPKRYINGSYRPVREGFQELWIRISKNFKLHLGVKIKAIARTPAGITITTETDSFQFDKLVISCPPDKLNGVLDASKAEQAIFKTIVYNPGYRGAFIAKHAPTDGIYWYIDSYENKSGKAYLSLMIPEGKVDDTSCLYSCVFAYCDDQANAVSILQQSTEQFLKETYNAEITEWVKMQYWADYGCEFEIETVMDGVFDKIQALQGALNTYYTGQLVGSASHSAVVDYSYELINLHF